MGSNHSISGIYEKFARERLGNFSVVLNIISSKAAGKQRELSWDQKGTVRVS